MDKKITHIKDLTFDPRNPRKHNPRNIGMIVDSLQEVGAARSIVIDENGVILAGNGLVEGAAQAGMEKVQIVDADGDTIIAVRRHGLSEQQKQRLKVFDNRTAELAEWDMPVLSEMQDEGLLDRLFQTDELDKLMDSFKQEEPVVDAGGDEFTDEPDEQQTRVKLGDLWQVGKHRILCDDCTDYGAVQRLMGGEKAVGVFTSPPYAEQRASHYASIHEDDYVAWWESIQSNVRSILTDDGSFFINIKPHAHNGERSLYVMDLVMAMKREWGWKYVDELCWLRITAPGSWPDRFKNGFEPIHHFSVGQVRFRPKHVRYEGEVPDNTAPMHNNAGTGYYYHVRQRNVMGLAYPDNVIDLKQSDKGIDHPAIFPVALPSFFYQAYSDPNDLWVDTFLGSGTGIVAAHRTNRRCYGLDNSPSYCNLAIGRAEAEGISPITLLERIEG